MIMSLRHAVIALVFAARLPGALAAQTLSLAEALRRAESGAYANRVAEAQARAQEAQASLALRGVLPSVRVEGGYVRTTDPLGAFGSTLRQRAVTPTAFEPSRLNDPAAIGNVGSALVIEQPIFNADALRSPSRGAAGRRRASEDWARPERGDVVRPTTALLARSRWPRRQRGPRGPRTSASPVPAPQRLATKSDALLAAVRAGQVDAELIAARGTANLARAQPALGLGPCRHQPRLCRNTCRTRR
jgi:hypothetical protein